MTDILIAGAGIGGLTAALCLHARGISVRVLEAAPALRPLGVGINLLPHGAAVLHELGLADELAATAIQTRALEYRTRFGQLILSDPRGLEAGLPFPQYSIHRGALQMLLYRAAMERLPAGSIQTATRVTGLAQTGDRVEVTVTRAQDRGDEQRIVAGGLIGADGNRSAICAAIHPDAARLRWNGITMWRGAVEVPRFLDGRTMVMAGHHEHKIVLYPISIEADRRGRSLLNWVAEQQTGFDGPLDDAGDWNRPAEAADVAGRFEGMCANLIDLPALFRATPQILLYPMVDRDPLPRWSEHRVTIMGDAAHPMWPIGSNGASQAILDADALAEQVARTPHDMPAAFDAYDQIRRPATAAVVESNRALGPERVLALAHDRVHGPDDDVAALVPHAELERITSDYRRIAGFDAERLRERAARGAA